jgi:hypothetical protein
MVLLLFTPELTFIYHTHQQVVYEASDPQDNKFDLLASSQ